MSYKQDTEIEILCFVNKAQVLLLFTYVLLVYVLIKCMISFSLYTDPNNLLQFSLKLNLSIKIVEQSIKYTQSKFYFKIQDFSKTLLRFLNQEMLEHVVAYLCYDIINLLFRQRYLLRITSQCVCNWKIIKSPPCFPVTQRFEINLK